MRVAHHPGNARYGRHGFGRTLRITSGHENARFGILAMHPADGGAGVVIGLRGNGAGVQDDQISALRRGTRRQSTRG